MSETRYYVDFHAVRALIEAEIKRHDHERGKHIASTSHHYDREDGASDALHELHQKLCELDLRVMKAES